MCFSFATQSPYCRSPSLPSLTFLNIQTKVWHALQPLFHYTPLLNFIFYSIINHSLPLFINLLDIALLFFFLLINKILRVFSTGHLTKVKARLLGSKNTYKGLMRLPTNGSSHQQKESNSHPYRIQIHSLLTILTFTG